MTALSNMHYVDIKEKPIMDKKIAKLGMTCTEIMLKAGCSINTARKYVRLRGIALGKGPMNEKVIPMREAEMVVKDIQAALERRRAHPKAAIKSKASRKKQ